MRHRNPRDCRCSYLVVIKRDREADDDLPDLAAYLSTLGLAGCEVIIVDGSPAPVFEKNHRVLRWVSRHIAVRPRHHSFSGAVDVIRTALDVSNCDRIIVADENVRYADTAVASLCELLDGHEVVEPQDYFHPLPWWPVHRNGY